MNSSSSMITRLSSNCLSAAARSFRSSCRSTQPVDRSPHSSCWRSDPHGLLSSSLSLCPPHSTSTGGTRTWSTTASNTSTRITILNNSISSSSSRDSRRYVGLAAHRVTAPPKITNISPSLDAATQQLAALATPSTSWSPPAQAAVQAAEQALHGRFFVVSCGNWAQDHPKAGQPAHALLQMVLVAMFNAEGAPSPYSVQGQTVNLYALREAEDKTLPMVTYVLYELDSNGWPTGVAYQSATAFEKLTDRQHYKKPLNSFDIWCHGQQQTRLINYFKAELQPRGVEVPPRQLAPAVTRWLHDQLTAAGVQVAGPVRQ